MKRVFLLLTLISCGLFLAGKTQAITTFWEGLIGSGSDDTQSLRGFAVRQTPDGGYILAGNMVMSKGEEIIKLNDSGGVDWAINLGERDPNSPRVDLYTIDLVAGGGYIVAGQDDSLWGAVIKIDDLGNIVWQKKIIITGSPTVGSFLIKSVKQVSDGSFVLVGYTINKYNTTPTAVIVKIDSFGNRLWTHRLNVNRSSELNDVYENSDGDYVATGYYGLSTAKKMMVAKYGSDGEKKQIKLFSSTNIAGSSIQQNSDSKDYIVTGDIFTSTGGSLRGLFLAKIHPDLNSIAWSKSILINYMSGQTVQQTSDGGYIVAGQYWSSTPVNYDVVLLKFNSSGDLSWAKKIGGGQREENSYAQPVVQQTLDGGYVLTLGGSSGSPIPDYNIAILKTDEKGDIADDPCGFNVSADTLFTVNSYSLTISDLTDVVDGAHEYSENLSDSGLTRDFISPGLPDIIKRCAKPVACKSHNVSGWAWSNNIGWISTNCQNTMNIGEGNNFGLDISAAGAISGYAWSDSIGWIDFAPTIGFPSAPNFSARVDIDGSACGSIGKICGWARACSVFVTGCSGTLKPDTERGGWDGWIKLSKDSGDAGGNYGLSLNFGVSPAQFQGLAWGSIVSGWISFDKVTTTFSINSPPVAQMSCDGSGCSGSQCGMTWSSYEPTASPSPCIYKIKNDSTDPDGASDIVVSRWYIKASGAPDTSYVQKLSCTGLCDYTIQSDVGNGNFDLKLYVQDLKGLFSEAVHQVAVKKEISADFQCSLDNSVWQSCSGLSVIQNKIFYFKDISLASEGQSISLRRWKNNGTAFDGASANPSLVLSASDNIIGLTVTDSAGRSDYQEYSISALPALPDWKEVPPSSFINKLLAAVLNFLKF